MRILLKSVAAFEDGRNEIVRILRIIARDESVEVGNCNAAHSARTQYSQRLANAIVGHHGGQVFEHVAGKHGLKAIVGEWEAFCHIKIAQFAENTLAMLKISLLIQQTRRAKDGRGQRKSRDPDVGRNVRVDPALDRLVEAAQVQLLSHKFMNYVQSPGSSDRLDFPARPHEVDRF